METVGSAAVWVGFTLLVFAALALDLGVFHRRPHEVGMREAARASAFWVGLALAFNLFVYFRYGTQRGLEFLTGYLIEEALSVDNLFVFMVIFKSFAVPKAYQHRVLFWGILGAMVMRGIFIATGTAMIHRFHWIIYVFGAMLVVTGVKLLFQRGVEAHPERNPIYRLFRRLVPAVPEYEGTRFTVVREGRRYATPLLLVLVAVEASDLVFAVDSIPAVLAITRDPFIVYTSNIFAILGLRSLYSLLSNAMGRFHQLHVGLALVLSFVGVKMILSDVLHIPVGVSLAVVASLLGGAVAASLLLPGRTRALPADD